MKMTFLKLFLICTFKDPNLAEKLPNLAEFFKKKFNFTEFRDFVCSRSDPREETRNKEKVKRSKEDTETRIKM